MKRNPFFWLSVVLLHVVIAAPAFAQMQGSANYSDAWGDTSYLYGSGVTDSPYNNYNHTFRAVTTLRSPSGRVSSTDTGYGSYASAFVSLSFAANDMGLYTVDTDHYDYCPIVFQEIFVGSSGDSVSVTGGYSISYHYKGNPTFEDPSKCYYLVHVPCSVRCRKPDQWITTCGGAWKRTHWDFTGIGSATFCDPFWTTTDHASRLGDCRDE